MPTASRTKTAPASTQITPAFDTAQETIKISAYDALDAEIGIAEQDADAQRFDYEDPKQNKAARSHVFKLRKLRSAVENARKSAKSYALAYGRTVDANAAKLADRVSALIDPHESAIRAIEAREAARVAFHQNRIQEISDLAEGSAFMHSTEIERNLDKLNEFFDVIFATGGEGFQEFTPDADTAYNLAVVALESALGAALQREADAEDLARLRAAEAEAAEPASPPPITAAPPEPAPPAPPAAPALLTTNQAAKHLKNDLRDLYMTRTMEAFIHDLIRGELHPAIRIDWDLLCRGE